MNNINKKALQTIQNVLAVTFGISLRILKKNAWEIFYDKLADNRMFKDEFPDKIDFANFLKNCICDNTVPEDFVGFTKKYFNNEQINNVKEFWNTYPSLEAKYFWNTFPSNLSPYYKRITQSPHVNICTLLCFFKYCLILEEKKDYDFILSKSFTGTLNYITGLSNNSILFVGYQFEAHTENYLDVDKESYLDGLVALQQEFCSIQSYFTKKDLTLLSHQRMPISKQRLEEKAKTIKIIFNKILSFIKKYNKSKNFSHSDWINLTEIMSFFSDNLIINSFGNLFTGVKLDKEHNSVRFIFSNYDKYIFWYKFSLSKESLSKFAFIKFDEKRYGKFIKNAVYKGERFLLYGADVVYNRNVNFFKIIDRKFSDFLESNFAKRKARDAENLLDLHNSLYTNPKNSTLSDLPRMIINKAVNFVSADTGFYLRYSPHDKTLLLDTYPDDETWRDEKKVKQYKERIANWVKSSNERRDSIVFRAVNEREPIIINDLLSEGGDCLQVYDHQALSRLTIPIIFHARVLGVINADGFSRNQFSMDDLFLLNEFAKDIAPFIYQNNFLKKIENITKSALHTEMNDIDKLNNICKNIADIFFCAGTTLWLQDDVDPKLYKLSASYNYKYLKPTKMNDYKYIYGEGLSGECVRNNEILYENNVENIKDKLLFGENLITQRYNSVMVVPISLSDEEVPIGSLSVYDYTMQYESLKTSSYLLGMIGRFLALAITAVKELHRGEKQYIELTAHELGQSVTSLSNTIKRLMDNFDSLIPARTRGRDLSRTRSDKVFLLLEDINEYIKDVEGTLSALVSDDIEGELEIKRRSVAGVLIKKYTAGKKENIDIHSEIKNIAHGKLKTYRDKRITFKISGQNFSFNWYKPAVVRVLNNVIDNAIKYIDNKNPFLHIEMRRMHYLNEVIVSNSGIEILPDEYEDIFRYGYRSRRAKSVCIDGKGLGLYLSRFLARSWTGRVYVKECTKIPEFKELYKTSFAIVFPKLIN